jgi:hypothetical protein
MSAVRNCINVVVLPYERPNKVQHFHESMSKYGFSSKCTKNWHKEVGISDWNIYKQNDAHLVEIRIVEPFKIFMQRSAADGD